MDIGLLRVFQAVATEGSVSKASKRLNCVQSNVTARVRQLENELETSLFYRKKNRGMALTPAGRVLLEYANRALHLIREAEIAVRDTGEVMGGLSIGSTESTAAVRLPPVLTHYHREYPNVEIALSTDASEKLIEKVLEYKLDGAFVCGPLDHTDIEQLPILREELVIVTDIRIKTLKVLENPTLVVFPEGCAYRTVLETWLRHSGIVPYKVMELRSLEGVLGCVSAGMGIAMYPRSVITNLKYTGKVGMHAVTGDFATVPTLFVRRKDTVMTRAMSAFIQTCMDIYNT